MKLSLSIFFCVGALLAAMASARYLQQTPTYTPSDIAEHNTKGDIWVGSLDTNKVYDLSNFMHPGGANAILDVAGTVQEFTDAFGSQHGRSFGPKGILRRYEIGDLAN